MLEARNLSKYYNGKPALAEVNFTVNKGDVFCLQGDFDKLPSFAYQYNAVASGQSENGLALLGYAILTLFFALVLYSRASYKTIAA